MLLAAPLRAGLLRSFGVLDMARARLGPVSKVVLRPANEAPSPAPSRQPADGAARRARTFRRSVRSFRVPELIPARRASRPSLTLRSMGGAARLTPTSILPLCSGDR